MKTIRILATIMLSGGPALALGQIDMPNPAAPGATPESAVRIVATNDLMVERFIARWLRQHYPDWSADPHEYMDIGNERYAVVYITSPNNAGRRVYFRVLSNQSDDDRGPFLNR